MTEFIEMATKSLGIDDKTARSATGGLLGFIKGQVDPQVFDKLETQLPGAAGMMSAAPEQDAGASKGLLGGLAGRAASAVGGGMGGSVELAGLLGRSGLGTSQVGSFVTLFVNFIKQKADPSLVRSLMEKVPQLAKLT